MILVIDNYDSFTFNLVGYLDELGADCLVVRNDALSTEQILALAPRAVIVSPGPKTPDEAGVAVSLIRAAAASLPVLGVCLGHQAIGRAFGGEVVRAETPMHGKVSAIRHRGEGLFEGVPDGFRAARYHSLVLRRAGLPACLEATAWSDDGEIMGVRHRSRPVHGVQFHPESIATQHGHHLLRNFLALAGGRPAALT